MGLKRNTGIEIMVREIVVDVVEGAWDATEFRERATSATMELNNNGLLLALHVLLLCDRLVLLFRTLERLN